VPAPQAVGFRTAIGPGPSYAAVPAGPCLAASAPRPRISAGAREQKATLQFVREPLVEDHFDGPAGPAVAALLSRPAVRPRRAVGAFLALHFRHGIPAIYALVPIFSGHPGAPGLTLREDADRLVRGRADQVEAFRIILDPDERRVGIIRRGQR